MENKSISVEGSQLLLPGPGQPTGRRTFLRWSGGLALALFAVGCEESPAGLAADEDAGTGSLAQGGALSNGAQQVTLDFSNDFGVLNYAYALEQLEAAFYSIVAADFYAGASEQEREVLRDLRDHEVVHRDFFEAALGNAAIAELGFDFSAVNFDSRASVLETAQTFEDLGVSAYNGAGRLIEDPNLLLVAGKIVSVEARHASAIRDLLRSNGRSFAPSAFDKPRNPREVLAMASPFITTEINVTNLRRG